VIVSTGTRASLEPIPGLAEAQPLTHIEALELDEISEHLLVIGGGYVGVELSQAMRRFGSKVTVVDRNGRLMSKEDPDICEALRSLLADEGIDILLNAVPRANSRSKSRLPLAIVAISAAPPSLPRNRERASNVLSWTGLNPQGRARQCWRPGASGNDRLTLPSVDISLVAGFWRAAL
jgi:pyruvate/2-oxoglutarate dehydrogenase complex dihydrolipoamide dehydrogenase (E3) component